jgi:hypothetical protein
VAIEKQLSVAAVLSASGNPVGQWQHCEVCSLSKGSQWLLEIDRFEQLASCSRPPVSLSIARLIRTGNASSEAAFQGFGNRPNRQRASESPSRHHRLDITVSTLEKHRSKMGRICELSDEHELRLLARVN